MSDLKERFETASREVHQLPEKPGNADLLHLYGLFKQATAGDVTGKRPGLFDLVGRAKHDAWADLSGTDADEAMNRYVELVTRLQGE